MIAINIYLAVINKYTSYRTSVIKSWYFNKIIIMLKMYHVTIDCSLIKAVHLPIGSPFIKMQYWQTRSTL